MKKQISFILLSICLSFILCNTGLGQTNPKSLNKDDIKLKVELAKSEVKVDEKITLKVHLKNNFSEKVSLPYCLSDNFDGYQVEIFDAEEKAIQPTTEPFIYKGFESWTAFELMPAEEQKFSLLISYFYQLPAGKYSIKVTRKVNSSVKRESVLVESEKVILTVVE